jgi:hypothetical protein
MLIIIGQKYLFYIFEKKLLCYQMLANTLLDPFYI